MFDKQKADKKPEGVHWIGVVDPAEKYVPGLSAKILEIVKQHGHDKARVIFVTKRMREYVSDRLDRGSEIFFGSKSLGGLVRRYGLIRDETRRCTST